MFFSMKGRLNRAKYVWHWLAVNLVAGLIGVGVGLETANPLLLILELVISAAFAGVMSFPIVKRLHDLNKSGAQYWLLFVPIYNLYFLLSLFFQAGSIGTNDYGQDPLVDAPIKSKKKLKILDTKYFGLIIGAFIVIVFVLITEFTGILNTLELKTLDVYFQYKNQSRPTVIQDGVKVDAPNPSISSDILIIGIDSRSLDTLGKWPFPRYQEANLINNFARIKDQNQRESSLFLDIFFIEPDSKAYDDVLLIESIENSGRVFLETVLKETSPSASSAAEFFERQEILYEGWGYVKNIEGDWPEVVAFYGVEPPLKPYARATKGYGHANFAEDLDKTYRRQPLIAKSSMLLEEIRLDNFTPDTPLNRDNFERLEWVDKESVRHNVPYPHTQDVILKLIADMEKDAPQRLIDTDDDGEPDDAFFVIRKYRDRFLPAITLSLALQYFNKTLEDVEVVLGKHILIPAPQHFDEEQEKWVPYEITTEFPKYDENNELIEEGKTRPVPEICIPINDQGQMLINFMGQRSFETSDGHQTYPIRSFSGYASNPAGANPATWPRTRAVGTKILMTGPFTHGMAEDEKTTPYGLMYGVEIHANALNTIIMDNFLTEVPFWVDLAVLAILVMLIAFLTSRMSTIWSLVISIVLIAVMFIAISLVFDITSYIVNFSAPGIAVFFTFLSVVVYRIMTEEKDKRRIRDMFGKYVSPQVVDQILENPPELGGVDKELTVFFSDIRGFTSLSEAMPPQELVNHHNLYLTAMTDLILEYRGTLDKYVGDEIMCFWGAPLPQEDHAVLACKCALRQMQKLGELNSEWPEERRINIGIGLNSGIMTVGNMGSLGRMNYTLMGDAVNLGARLEGTNKAYYTNIIISEYTYGLVRDRVTVRELDNIRVVGKNKPVLIYELIDVIDGLDPPAPIGSKDAQKNADQPASKEE